MPTMTPSRPRRRPLVSGQRLDTAWNAERLRAAWDARPLRDEAGRDLTATRIAAVLGITTETLREWRAGRHVPDAIEIGVLARLLGTTRDAVLPPE